MSTTIEGIAIGLIEALGAENTREHVAGVVQVLEGVIQGVHCQWEQHINKETNSALAVDVIGCPTCGEKLKITRTRNIVNVEEV